LGRHFGVGIQETPKEKKNLEPTPPKGKGCGGEKKWVALDKGHNWISTEKKTNGEGKSP